MSSWIKEVLEATEEAETPRQWIYWACLSSIAAVSSFNVWKDQNFYKLAPNIYVMLIGKSGLGKGFPIWLAEYLTSKVDNTRVISGRNSIQALIGELSKMKSKQEGESIKDGRAFLISAEFANFVIEDPQALTILTEWYDTHANSDRPWRNSLKGTGIESIKNLNITMLGAAAPIHFRQVVPENAIGGGFIGRTLIIYATKAHKINAQVRRAEKKFDPDGLAKYLVEVSKVKGEFHFEEKAEDVFSDWYKEFKSKDQQDDTGTDNRMKDHVLKLTMLLSLSERLDRVATESHVSEAIRLCNELISGSNKARLGAGKNPIAEQTSIIVKYLLENGNYCARSFLLRKFWGQLDAFDLDRIEVTLESAKAWTIQNNGKEKTYQLTPQFVEQIIGKKEEEKK